MTLKKVISVLLVAFLVISVPITNFCTAVVFAAEVEDFGFLTASPSDALPEADALPDPILDQMAYEQTFDDYPNTLIGRSRGRSALAAAVEAALDILAACCGMSFATQADKLNFFGGFESWMRAEHAENKAAQESYQMILAASWSMTLKGSAELLKLLREYVSGKVKVTPIEGTNTGRIDVSLGKAITSRFSTVASLNDYASRYLYSVRVNNRYCDFYMDIGSVTTPKKFPLAYYLAFINGSYYLTFYYYNSSGLLAITRPSCIFSDFSSSGDFVMGHVFQDITLASVDGKAVGAKELASYLPVPLFLDQSSAKTFINSGVLTNVVSADDTYDLGRYWPGTITTDTDITLPASDVWDQSKDDISTAMTIAAVAAALAGIINGKVDTGDPDTPDITGILSGLNAILSALTGIPAGLVSALINSTFLNPVIQAISGLADPLAQIAQWDFADWTTALGALMLLNVKAAMKAIGLDVVAGTLGDISGVLNGLKLGDLVNLKDWIAAIPVSIVAALVSKVAEKPQDESERSYQVSSIIVDKFPFCIPFDLIACVTVLAAESVPPIWEIPFKVDLGFVQINESLTLDLSTTNFDGPVTVVRGFILLLYVYGLVVLTKRLIK